MTSVLLAIFVLLVFTGCISAYKALGAYRIELAVIGLLASITCVLVALLVALLLVELHVKGVL